jgi:hypothetical protein
VAVATGLACLALSGVAGAHHSLYGVYDPNREVTVEGVIAEFHFVSPHPYVSADILANGRTARWRLELDNRHELVDIGISDTTLKPGDRIVVSGNPGRGTPMQSLYVRALDRRTDGFRYEQVGSSPRARFVPR